MPNPLCVRQSLSRTELHVHYFFVFHALQKRLSVRRNWSLHLAPVYRAILWKHSFHVSEKISRLERLEKALELQHDSNVLYYRIDAVEMPCFMTISDGDAEISAGLGGAFPSMDHQHIKCWSHLSPDMKNKWNKSTDWNLQIPESALNHITERRKNKKQRNDWRNARNIFDQVRFTSSSGLGDLLMHSLHLSLVTGHGYMAPLRVRLPEFSERVRS